ncbi:hypothetical protein [Nocardia lijiangensis]|uniref:hypothetical protein n=1 Tax=Nocardia lijiangensis TaxID=299618 RepID=UPI0008357A0C|nr:hypothetical protein [Nocardia lijiangensis]
MPTTDGVDSFESTTTHHVARHERADYWAELVQSHQRARLSSVFPHQRDFHGRSVRRRTASYQMIGWEADAVTYYRTAEHVCTDSDEDYRLMLPTTGHITIRQNDRHTSMAPGTGCLP